MERPKSRLAPAMIVAGFLCAVLGLYIAGYLSCQSGGWGTISYRQVTAEWETTLYAPAAWVESLIRRNRVALLPPARVWQVAPDGGPKE